MPDSQRHPLSLLISNVVEDIYGFTGLKLLNYDNSCMSPCSRSAEVTLVVKPQLKIIRFSKL